MAKHERTLAAIFARPTRANIKWSDIESLFVSLGAVVEESRDVGARHGEPVGAVPLAAFQERVEVVEHVGGTRVRQNASIAQPAMAPFHAPLKPADHVP